MDKPGPVFDEPPAEPPVIPEDGAYDEEPAERVPGSFLGTLPQFFVFPAILVATLAAVYLLLRVLVGTEARDAAELMAEVREAPGPHARWQALYSLADGLRREAITLDGVSTEELVELYESFSAQGFNERYYLLQIMGHKGDPTLTPYALRALDDEDLEMRLSALAALGGLADAGATAALAAHLRGATDRLERQYALGALGNIRSGEARDVIAEQLEGDDTLVARNAALILAEAGDERARPWLLGMLERRSYARDAGLEAESREMMDEESREASRESVVEQFLVRACQAAAALGDPSAVPALRKLREGDQSLRVRSAAIDALHRMGVPSEST